MAASIYDQHDKAFSNVSAFVVLGRSSDEFGNPRRVATVAIKFPKDGASRLWAYVHWVGVAMVRAEAGGYGYDKRTAAVSACAPRLEAPFRCLSEWEHDTKADADERAAFLAALSKDDGQDWTDNLRKAGFTVLQAV